MILLEKFRKDKKEELEIVGTVKEIVGKDGFIYYSNENNVMNPEKKLQITFEDKDGTTEKILASDSLTRLLRKKEWTLDDVMLYGSVYVTKFTTKDGVAVEDLRVGINEGNSLKDVNKVSSNIKKAKEEKKKTLADFEGYIAF